MSKLGAYSFTSFTGQVGTYGVAVEDEVRPGVNGHTFRELGFRGEPFSIQTKATFSSKSLAQKGVQDYELLRGTFNVLVDPIGTSYRKVLVLKVTTRIFPIEASTDGKDYLLEASWSLQRCG